MSTITVARAAKSVTISTVLKAERKRTLLLSQLKDTNALIRDSKRALNGGKRGPNAQTYAGKIRQFALSANGSFTTRDAANAVLNGGRPVTEEDTRRASNTLKLMTDSGLLARVPVSPFDAKNSGQLLYSRRAR